VGTRPLLADHAANAVVGQAVKCWSSATKLWFMRVSFEQQVWQNCNTR
jgi:hypothetical protein